MTGATGLVRSKMAESLRVSDIGPIAADVDGVSAAPAVATRGDEASVRRDLTRRPP